MELINTFYSTKQYLSRYWNNQQTKKYLFVVNNKQVEAGYFIHYMENKIVRHIIELSASHGCPMKCKFCASSSITPVKGLLQDEIFEVFEYIYNDNNLSTCDYVLVAMAGIGELYFTFDNVKEFVLKANTNYDNLRFATSSCCMDSGLFTALENLSKQVTFDNIQITHISTDVEKNKFLIPGIPKLINSTEVAKLISLSTLDVIRINYLLIKDINDSTDDIKRFAECYLPIKDNIVVKISTLNATATSRLNKLESGDIDRAREFCNYLEELGFICYVFHSFLDDKMNCGQLASECE